MIAVIQFFVLFVLFWFGFWILCPTLMKICNMNPQGKISTTENGRDLACWEDIHEAITSFKNVTKFRLSYFKGYVLVLCGSWIRELRVKTEIWELKSLHSASITWARIPLLNRLLCLRNLTETKNECFLGTHMI